MLSLAVQTVHDTPVEYTPAPKRCPWHAAVLVQRCSTQTVCLWAALADPIVDVMMTGIAGGGLCCWEELLADALYS